jgi:NHS family xanthosine MFS transporter
MQICMDWRNIWLSFAAYALLMTIVFVPLFKYRHVRRESAPLPREA